MEVAFAQPYDLSKENGENEEDYKMSFGENLQYLRKQKEITQEQLAEQLEVSRQSVSKWESGQSYPEMEKLLQICSMFHCNMDTLMQGDISKTFAEDIHGYDKFKNLFSRMIAAGVGVLLLGIAIMMLLTGVGIDETMATAVFFVFLIIAVMVFIVMGMQDDQFQKKHPVIEDFYTEEEKDQAYRKFTVRIAVGVGMILVAVLFMMVGGGRVESLGPADSVNVESLESLLTGAFMILIAVAVSVIVYAGLQKSKYDVAAYNKESNPTPEKKKRDALIGKLCGCIMMVATIIFLIWGFLGQGFGIAWIIYAVAGILCGVVAVALGKDDSQN